MRLGPTATPLVPSGDIATSVKPSTLAAEGVDCANTPGLVSWKMWPELVTNTISLAVGYAIAAIVSVVPVLTGVQMDAARAAPAGASSAARTRATRRERMGFKTASPGFIFRCGPGFHPGPRSGQPIATSSGS